MFVRSAADSGRGSIPLKLNQLNDQLEVEDFLEEQREFLERAPGVIVPDVNLLLYAYNDSDFSRFPGLRWRNPL